MRLTKQYEHGVVMTWEAQFSDVLQKLAAYEDAEEQGRLAILPCKVGDMVYYRRGRDIIGDTVERIIIDGLDNQVLVGAYKVYMFRDFGSKVFLTREEAALKRGQDDYELKPCPFCGGNDEFRQTAYGTTTENKL